MILQQSNGCIKTKYSSFLIGKKNTRNKACAWQVIAYVPHEKNFYSPAEISKFSPELKTFCMQQLYKAALSSLIDTQKLGALDGVRL